MNQNENKNNSSNHTNNKVKQFDVEVLEYAELPKGYTPSEDEEYMNEMHLKYFRNKLLDERKALLLYSESTLKYLQDEDLKEPDITDRASAELEINVELKLEERKNKLLPKIIAALKRIDSGHYGYCCHSKEPIGVKRLMARPTATLSVTYQEKRERYKNTHNEY